MRIAIFSDTFYPQINGVSFFAFHLAENLAKRGHKVIVFATVSPEDEKKVDFSRFHFRLQNVPSFRSPIYRKENFRLTIPAGWTIKRLKKFHPDIIHFHTPFALGVEAVRGARKLNIPLVGEHHTFYDHYLKHINLDYEWARNFSWKFTVRFYGKCHLVVCPSQSLIDSLQKFGLKTAVEMIPNCVDTDFFQPLSKEEKLAIRKKYGVRGKLVVYMGRVSYEKNISAVIRAFNSLLKSNNNIDTKLMIIGSGPDEGNLKDLASQLGISDKIIWTGVLKDKNLVETMASADVFITASKSENMPLSIIEAMACGLPMVAVAEKGLKEIVKDGYNGFLSESDSENGLSEKLQMILENESVMENFSQNSRELALQYSNDNICERFEKCYQDLINKRIIKK